MPGSFRVVAMVKIAVLGANGFIGTRTVEMLTLNRQAEVRPLVRNYASLARLARFHLDARLADAFDQTALEAAFQGCEIVVHAVAGDIKTILGTLTPVYQAAQNAGVRRLVYLSSASVHGQSPDPGTDENSALSDGQILPYNNAKVRAERKLEELRGQGNVELVILRPGIVVGPRSSWVNRFTDDLRDGKAALLNRGQGICNSIYVDNLVHAIHLAATTPAVDREVFLVGDEEQVTWADLYRPIAKALGFDLGKLPEGHIVEQKKSWFERLEPVRSSRPVQGLLSVFPHRFRLAAFLAYQTILEPPPAPSTTPAEPPRPPISREMALLYACRYKLPHKKAIRMLSYQPPVPFEDACRRTVAWLAFAGHRIKEECRGAG